MHINYFNIVRVVVLFRLPDVLHNLNKKDRQIGLKHWNPPLLGPLPNDFLRLAVNCNVQANSVLYH